MKNYRNSKNVGSSQLGYISVPTKRPSNSNSLAGEYCFLFIKLIILDLLLLLMGSKMLAINNQRQHIDKSSNKLTNLF